MIVVDIGCYDHPRHEGVSQDSIGRLIDRFHPEAVYGLDPHPSLSPGEETRAGTRIVRERVAAWAWDGRVPFVADGLGSAVGGGPGDVQVRCVDFGNWMLALPFENHDVVVKIDAEGAEYVLLERLINLHIDDWLTLLLVEWHGDRPEDRARLEAGLSCPIEDWA